MRERVEEEEEEETERRLRKEGERGAGERGKARKTREIREQKVTERKTYLQELQSFRVRFVKATINYKIKTNAKQRQKR